MPWPIKDSDKLLSSGASFAPHEEMGKFEKAQWEEPFDPEGFSVSQAGFKGGYQLPNPVKKANLADDFDGPVFTELTGKQLDEYSTPGAS